MLCGAISQSGTSSAFLLVGFVTAGMLPLRNAILIASWSDVGISLLVFLASANIKLAILYFLAVSGAAYSLDKYRKYDGALMACLGLGVLLFGCELVKSTAVQMTEIASIQKLMGMAEHSLFLLFLLGAALRVVTQSSSSVAILCIPLLKAGLLSLPQSAVMVCGTGFGAAVARSLLSGNLPGMARQLILFKSLSDAISGFLLFGLLFLTTHQGEVILIPGLQRVTSSTASGIAIIFVVAKLAPTVISIIFGKPLRALAVQFSPVSLEESMARLKYLHEHAMGNPEMATELADLESGRILKRLPRYLNIVREKEREAELKAMENSGVSTDEGLREQIDKAGTKKGLVKTDVDLMHNASMELGTEISRVLTEMIQLDLAYESSERLLQIQNKHQAVMDLAVAVRDLVIYLKASAATEGLEDLCFGMTEGLNTMLYLAIEAKSSNDGYDSEMLFQITSDNGPLMEEVRSSYLKGDQSISPTARPVLLQLTNQYQRAVWLLSRWAWYSRHTRGESAKSLSETASAAVAQSN
jgi:phosphate:Na+ symporter